MNLTSLLTYNTIYRLLNIAVVYATVVLLSKLAGVEGYGLLSLMIVNATFFNLVSAFGADAGITYHTSGTYLQPAKINTIIFFVVISQVMLFAIVEVTCYSITGHYWIYKSYSVQYWWMGLLFMLSISITEKYAALFNGYHLFTLHSQVLLFSNLLILLVFLMGFFFSMHYGTKLVVLYILLYFLQAVVLVVVFYRSTQSGFSVTAINTRELVSFLSFSVITLVTNLVQFLAYRIDYWFIDHYRGTRDLGWYSLAVRLVQAFWILPILFAGILFPQVAREKDEYSNDKMLSFIRMLLCLNAVAGFIGFFLIKWLIPFAFGAIYAESIRPFQILLPGIILFCPATIIAAYFAGKRLLRINLSGSVICFASILLLDMLLIPPFGIKGAAVASTVGYSVTGIYFAIAYCLKTRTPVHQLFYPRLSDVQHFKKAICRIF